ncbi:uncharacterized protein LOC125225388 isoform X2 [Leguminivora glycinivorella]|uniref:uncharacterized protein LOC125225388 isoform X2 n=1 Tax=Leguminivora glycinivorella TaxID=1035111 RepID=UPI00200BECFD|nr:uncharacterized protein LOC125225388 isoform X2 [Leguminivora glycinivorella]
MDQKSSLTDPTLKIYPSEKLVKFLQTIKSNYEIPENILQFIKSHPNKGNDKIKLKNVEQAYHLSDSDVSKLEKIKAEVKKLDDDNDQNVDNMPKKVLKENGSGDKKRQLESDDTEMEKVLQDGDKARDGPFLKTSDLDWLYVYLNTIRNTETDTPYLHELMEGVHIEMPENSVIKRNPVLEERCVKLRAQQEARDYRKMTKGVDNVRIRFPDDTIAFQLKQLNRQLIAIGQFIISIFAGFLFGFRGVEWMVGNLDFGFRLLLGVMCALVIALAEIYFLAKKLNEELSVPETTQIGGPPKFVDQEKYGTQKKVVINKSVNNKEHQD